ncbi:unnamed protein product [marine sediment metagenome]|uniref:Uncharacterized protein n=1 Tax=marine sediment metagenome TaxID=412755 RepID=X1H6L2_9ZZZZ
MGIKDKATYGEYYFATQVEANGLYDEELESAFAPFFQGVLSEFPELDELPPGIKNFVKALSEPPSAGFGGFALGVGVEMIDEVLHTIFGPVTAMMKRALNRRALETWLTPAQVNTLWRRGKITEGLWEQTLASERL